MDKQQELSEDFTEGLRTGFEAARRELEQAVESAIATGTSVRKAIKNVKVPENVKVPTGLEYRGG